MLCYGMVWCVCKLKLEEEYPSNFLKENERKHKHCKDTLGGGGEGLGVGSWEHLFYPLTILCHTSIAFIITMASSSTGIAAGSVGCRYNWCNIDIAAHVNAVIYKWKKRNNAILPTNMDFTVSLSLPFSHSVCTRYKQYEHVSLWSNV